MFVVVVNYFKFKGLECVEDLVEDVLDIDVI